MKATGVRQLTIVLAAMAALTISLGMAAAPAQAELLNLTTAFPDVTAGYLNVDYQASTGAFNVTGDSLAIEVDGIAPPDFDIVDGGGAYAIHLVLNSQGEPQSGTLTIGGKVPLLGALSGTLLTGNISKFGFQEPPGGDIFEFVFNVTGGDVAPYVPTGQVGVIFAAQDSGFTGDFSQSFASTVPLGVSDNFMVPEPATPILLLCLALGGFAGWVRRRLRAR